MVLCLLYMPTVRLPTPLTRACVAIAAATYHIYLFGGFAPDLLDGLIGRPLPEALHSVIAVVSGVALGLSLFWAQRACGRVVAARLPQAWQSWRGARQRSRV